MHVSHPHGENEMNKKHWQSSRNGNKESRRLKEKILQSTKVGSEMDERKL